MSGQSSLRLACNIIYGEACKATVDTGAKMLRKMEREVDKADHKVNRNPFLPRLFPLVY